MMAFHVGGRPCLLLAAVFIGSLLLHHACAFEYDKGVKKTKAAAENPILPVALFEASPTQHRRFAGDLTEGSGGAEEEEAEEEEGIAELGASSAAPQPAQPNVPVMGVFNSPQPVLAAGGELYSRPVCQAPDGDRGVCHPRIGCYLRGGTFSSVCADDHGVCCIFKHSCNIATKERLTYYRNPKYPESDVGNMLCNYRVDVGAEICGVRFEVLNYTTPVHKSCVDSQLVYMVGSTERTMPVCGILKGYSVTIPATKQDGPVVISHVLGGVVPYLFNIRVTQIRCSSVPQRQQLPGQGSVCGRRNLGQVRHRREARHGAEWDPAAFPAFRAATSAQARRQEQEQAFTTSTLEAVSPWLHFPYSYLKQFEMEGVQPVGAAQMTRILGGSETEINEWPWQVALLKRKNLTSKSIRFFCGGVLITDEYVVTAAHCVTNEKSFHFAEFAKHVIVSMGDHDLRVLDETKATFRGVREIMVHYRWDVVRNVDDIALIRLTSPVKFSGTILPACLPMTNRSYAHEDITITGFGVVSFNNSRPGPLSPVLKGVTVQSVDRATCDKLWKRFDSPRTVYPEFQPVSEKKLCVGTIPGAACFGDSGGPAQVREDNGRFTVVGVTSYGPPICSIGGLPSIFTRLSQYMYWIRLSTMHLFGSAR